MNSTPFECLCPECLFQPATWEVFMAFGMIIATVLGVGLQ